MIARIWCGWAPQERAGDYQRHYEPEVSEHLRTVSGFRGARLLRRDEGREVMFTSITWFASLDAVRDFWSFALLMAAWGSAAAGVPDSRMVIS